MRGDYHYRMVLGTLAAMTISFLFFFFDAIFDMRDHFATSEAYSSSELLHLFFEWVAVVTFLFGIITLREYAKRLNLDNKIAKRKLFTLKEDFDQMVREKFKAWALTAAEQDVALFLLRGLSTSVIAELRETTVGTVKVQSHNVFQKTGVTSRVEFMSLFLDEFIDIGMNQGES